MGKTASNGPPVAVMLTFGGHFDAYDIVRALGKGGIRSVVVSSISLNLASFSRYCRQVLTIPENTPETELSIVGELRRIADVLGGKPVLLYSSDPELFFVQKYRTELGEKYRFLLPPDELLDKLFSKVEFSRFASEQGIPAPFAVTLDRPEDLDRVRSRVQFPCIVKPAYQQDWRWETEDQMKFFGWYKNALRRIETMEELDEFCERLPQREAGFLIQSYIDGPDDTITSFHGYFDENSRCLDWFMGRKIRTYPPATGGSVYIQTIVDDELAKASIERLRRIKFQGIVKIDYKWDDAEKEYKMLEINPRYNLWQLLGAYAGSNLCVVAYRHQCGENHYSANGYLDDRRLLFFKADLRGYLTGYRKRGEWSFGSYVKSIMRRAVYRVLDPTDPLPFVWSSLHFVGSNLGKLLPGRPANGVKQ